MIFGIKISAACQELHFMNKNKYYFKFFSGKPVAA